MSINRDSFKRKNKTTKTTSNKKASKNPKGGSVNSLDLLGLGLDAAREIGNFYTTIKTERERTEQARETRKKVKIESDTRLKELELTLQKDIAMMNDSLERYKEDTKVKIKEIDSSTMIQIKHIETEQKRIDKEHEARMHTLKMQENTLNTMLELYKIYFTKKINGELKENGVDFDFSEIRLCIKSLEKSIMSFRIPSNVIESSYEEQEEI